MPEPISIGTYSLGQLLYNRLNRELPLAIDIDRVGDFTFLGCSLKDSSETGEKGKIETARDHIAGCLADFIVDEWEARIIKKIVRHNYYYYNEEEKRTILKKAKEILNPAGVDFQRGQRREKILLRILEYLDLHQEIILEGFINFRLKDYQSELENVVNSAVDEFLLEKEYQEFIRLLKYFVEIQEPRVNKAKIVFKKNGKFLLLDDINSPIQHECLEGLMADLRDNEINYDDLLISALITLAPKQVELHIEIGAEAGETIKTIHHVFGERVWQCPGCESCRT